MGRARFGSILLFFFILYMLVTALLKEEKKIPMKIVAFQTTV